MDPADQPCPVKLVLLRFNQEFPAVDKGKPIAAPHCFIRALFTQNYKGIILVAADPPDAPNRLYAVMDVFPLEIHFHAVPSIK